MVDRREPKIEGALARYGVYPWLFVLAPVASLLVQNVDAVRPGSAVRVSLVLLAITSAALLLGRRVFRDGRKAAVFWTLVVLTSFLLGHVAVSATADSPPDELADRYRIAFVVWLGASVLLAAAVARSRPIPSSVVVGLNGAGIVALGIPILLLVFLEVRMAN